MGHIKDRKVFIDTGATQGILCYYINISTNKAHPLSVSGCYILIMQRRQISIL